MSSGWLALRSIVWAILLPGMIAGYIPWRFFGVSRVHVEFGNPLQVLALISIGAGVVLLGTCIWEFGSMGRGTLSPADPAKELVVQGLYRYVRNPMYLSVSAIVLGEALLARSLALLGYWAGFFAAANLFVIFYEEPTLRRQFGESYQRYTERVGRWLPRWRH